MGGLSGGYKFFYNKNFWPRFSQFTASGSNGPDGDPGQFGNAKSGGLNGKTAVKKFSCTGKSIKIIFIETNDCKLYLNADLASLMKPKKTNGLFGELFGLKKEHGLRESITEGYMEIVNERGPNGNMPTDLNYANRLQPRQLGQTNLQSVLDDYFSAIGQLTHHLKSFSIWYSVESLNAIRSLF